VRFIDTNVLLYAISTDEHEAPKRETASELLDRRDLALSTQVLGEFYVQSTRETRPDPISHDQAVRLIESFTRFEVQPLTPAIVKAALGTTQRYGISYWDAAIVEAARESGCDEVLSEDLQDGQDFGGVRVVNPFTGSSGSDPPPAG
jgi:predicted nucleic acid-binding protein